MSDVLEYRAWHKEDKKMLHVCGIDWLINLDDDCVEVSTINCAERIQAGWVNGGEHHFDDVILMQWSGVKDKNGVKVYDGDKLFDFHSRGYGEVLKDDTKSIFLVKINEPLHDEFDSTMESISYLHDLDFSEIEVVGNIHES